MFLDYHVPTWKHWVVVYARSRPVEYLFLLVLLVWGHICLVLFFCLETRLLRIYAIV